MAIIAGLDDLRKHGAPGDIGTFVQPATAVVFQFTFSGTTTIVAMAVGVSGWTLIDQGAVVATVINAALTAVGGAVDGEVVVLEGAYTVLATLNVPESVLFRGVGWATIFNYNADGNCITITGDNAKIRDLKIVITAGAGGGGTRPNCILADTRANLEITKVWLVGDETVDDDGSSLRQCGIVFITVTFSRVSICRFNDHRRHGINLDASSYNAVTGNTLNGNGIHGIYPGLNSTNNTVTGNTSSGNGEHGIFVYSNTDNTVTGNICQGNTLYGILLLNTADNTTVTGNTCNGNLHGIRLDASLGNTVTGNTCNGNTEHGIYLDASLGNTVTGNTCNGNALFGIHFIDGADNNTVTGNTCNGNTEHGMHIDDSDNNTIVGNTCNENDVLNAGSYDGINITDVSLDNIIHSNTCNDNDRYGINIDDVRSLRNWVKNNQLRGNTSGPFNDSTANLTKLATKTFPFIAGGDAEGIAVWTSFVSASASAKGWSVTGADDWAVALSQLPLELQQVVRIKIWAVALGAPIDTGGQMHLDALLNAGASNLAYTTETVGVTGFDGVEADYVATDVVHWLIDAGDDADVNDLAGGMSIECKVIYAAGADPDGATNAILRAVEIEYV